MDTAMKDENFWEEFWQKEYGQAIYGYTKESLTDLFEQRKGLKEPYVLLQLKGQEPFLCHIKLEDGEQMVWENHFELNR